jgi:hypothetical protein
MKRTLSAALTFLVLALGAGVSLIAPAPAAAVTIEGQTPSGGVQQVGVSDTGALFVDILSTTPTHVTVDGGTITVKNIIDQPIQVIGGSGPPVTVTGTFTAAASTATVMVTGQVLVTSGGCSTIYPADLAKKQGCFCNDDPNGLNLWFGPASVTTPSNGKLLPAGSCACPDSPASYISDVCGASTTTVATSYFYVK